MVFFFGLSTTFASHTIVDNSQSIFVSTILQDPFVPGAERSKAKMPKVACSWHPSFRRSMARSYHPPNEQNWPKTWFGRFQHFFINIE
jgi:hypothetical protein